MFLICNAKSPSSADGLFCWVRNMALLHQLGWFGFSGGKGMSIRLHFWGAAQTVTGSSHHLECAGQNILLDCGMFQGHRQEARDINEHLGTPGGSGECCRPVACAHRSQRRSSAAGEAGISRADLHNTVDGRPVREDAEGQCAYSGVGRGVRESQDAQETIDWHSARSGCGVAALYAGGCGANDAAVQASDTAYSAVAGGVDGGCGVYFDDV